MSNTEIRIDFLDYQNFPKKDNLIYHILSSRYEVVIDSVSPDYVFVGPPQIYTKSEYTTQPIRIFWQTEANTTDFNLFDYSILRYDAISFEDRCFFKDYEWWWHAFASSYEKNNKQKKTIGERKKFTNFMYSHGAPERDRFFGLLNRRKAVDSLGSHLNNTGPLPTEKGRFGDNFFSSSIEIKSSYRFSIAFENTTYPEYTSEKILTSMLAGTIPIYWGDPRIGEKLNSRSFVNCHEYDSFEEVVERVLEIDSDSALRDSVLSEPFITELQLESLRSNLELSKINLSEFLYSIFDQPIDKARRRVWNRYSFDKSDFEKNPWFRFGKLSKIKKTKYLLAMLMKG